MDAFIQAQKTRKFDRFWTDVQREWFENWKEEGQQVVPAPENAENHRREVKDQIEKRIKVSTCIAKQQLNSPCSSNSRTGLIIRQRAEGSRRQNRSSSSTRRKRRVCHRKQSISHLNITRHMSHLYYKQRQGVTRVDKLKKLIFKTSNARCAKLMQTRQRTCVRKFWMT